MNRSAIAWSRLAAASAEFRLGLVEPSPLELGLNRDFSGFSALDAGDFAVDQLPEDFSDRNLEAFRFAFGKSVLSGR